MSGELSHGPEKGRDLQSKSEMDVSLPCRAAPGEMLRIDETPAYSQRSWRGVEHPVDLDSPLIPLISKSGDKYARGRLVYPIGEEGGNPWLRQTEDNIIVTSLSAVEANHVHMKPGTDVVALKELLQTSGVHTGISAQLRGEEVDFFIRGQSVAQCDAIETLLAHCALMRLPEEIRSSGITSKVGTQEDTKREAGIICNSLEEVAYLLKGYNDGSIRSSRATEDMLIKDVGESHGGLAVGFLAMAMESIKAGKAGLVDELIANIHEKVGQQQGKFSRHYDYDGMGSAFFKTSVDVEPVKDKFSLRIYAAYVGDKPEDELAKVAGKERALTSIGAKFQLTKIADNLVGVDLGRAFEGSGFHPELLARLAAREVEPGSDLEVVVVGEHGNYSVSVWLDQEENYSPEIFRAKGNWLFMNLEEEGEAYVELSVKMLGDDSRAITKDQKFEMTKIRDEVAALLRKSHS